MKFSIFGHNIENHKTCFILFWKLHIHFALPCTVNYKTIANGRNNLLQTYNLYVQSLYCDIENSFLNLGRNCLLFCLCFHLPDPRGECNNLVLPDVYWKQAIKEFSNRLSKNGERGNLGSGLGTIQKAFPPRSLFCSFCCCKVESTF